MSQTNGLTNNIKNIVIAAGMIGITYMAFDLYKQEIKREQRDGITINITGDKNDVLNNSNNNYKPSRRHNNKGYKPNTPRQTKPEYQSDTTKIDKYRDPEYDSRVKKTLEDNLNTTPIDTARTIDSTVNDVYQDNVGDTNSSDNYAINGEINIEKNVTETRTRGRDKDCNRFKKKSTITTYNISGIEKINANGQDYVIAMIDGIEGNNTKNTKEKQAPTRTMMSFREYNAFNNGAFRLVQIGGQFGAMYGTTFMPWMLDRGTGAYLSLEFQGNGYYATGRVSSRPSEFERAINTEMMFAPGHRPR